MTKELVRWKRQPKFSRYGVRLLDATLKEDICKRLLFLAGTTGYGKGTYKNY